MKTCTKCKIAKDFSEFYHDKKTQDGFTHWCKLCQSANQKKVQKANTAKNSLNKPTITQKKCALCKIIRPIEFFGSLLLSKDGFRSECTPCRNLKAANKYATDEEFRLKESVRFAMMYAKDPAKIINRTKRWSKNNPGKKVKQSQRRRAKKAGVELKDFNFEKIKSNQNNRCFYCEEHDSHLTIDHVIPLSQRGPHIGENIVGACDSCNKRKHARTPIQWIAHLQRILSKIEDSQEIAKINRMIRNATKLIKVTKITIWTLKI